MPANFGILETQQQPQDWKRSVFIPIPKKGNAKECSNYCTIELISHASKVMLKILQARLQQYVNRELPDVQAGFILLLLLLFLLAPSVIFFFIYFYQLEANYFTILQWFLSYIDMNQPWIYMCSPSQSSLRLPSPAHPSGSSQCTSPEHLSHATILGW